MAQPQPERLDHRVSWAGSDHEHTDHRDVGQLLRRRKGRHEQAEGQQGGDRADGAELHRIISSARPRTDLTPRDVRGPQIEDEFEL